MIGSLCLAIPFRKYFPAQARILYVDTARIFQVFTFQIVDAKLIAYTTRCKPGKKNQYE
jgi:hypothetical protein